MITSTCQSSITGINPDNCFTGVAALAIAFKAPRAHAAVN